MAETADLGPAVLDLKGIRAGDKNEMRVALLSDGAPWDTTGATVAAQARADKKDAAPALTAVVTAVDEAQGIYLVAWDGDEVRTLLALQETWEGVWDLQIQLPLELAPQTLVEGSIECVMDVTRP